MRMHPAFAHSYTRDAACSCCGRTTKTMLMQDDVRPWELCYACYKADLRPAGWLLMWEDLCMRHTQWGRGPDTRMEETQTPVTR